jgi:3'-phosphoadenosine 5'-phosphosulfate sulfotransferase (PAPS reductase)/FAD synthetase
MFSGGASSSYMSWLVAQEHPNDTILLHTPTHSEHPDADRFRAQVAKFIGLPITVQADGRDIWQLFDDNHTLPSHFHPFCTRILKQEQKEKYLKSVSDDFVLYYGFGISEWRRVQKQVARAEAEGVKVAHPIFDKRISDEKIKSIIIKQWGICLPEPYLYLKHNNCIPCFKAGKGEWYKYWQYYSEQFWKASEKEKQWRYTVFEDASLEELAAQWAAQPEQIPMDEWDARPCMCAF